jgi:hypothetical protein
VKRVILAAGLVGIAACSDATSPVSTGKDLTPTMSIDAGDNTVIVSETSIARQAENTTPTKSWVFYTRNAGTGAFVVGPATPTLSNGSFQLSTPGSNDKGYLFNYAHIGTSLSSIDAIEYSTYQVTPNPAEGRQLPAINIEVDYNGSAAGGYTTLVYEPVYNDASQAIVSGAWQSWNAYNGTWWSSNPINGLPNRDTFLDWATIVSLNPDAVIVGGFGVNQGGGNPGLVGAVIMNGGTTASVIDLNVTASGLANVCDGGNGRLRGILFDGASGTISNNHVSGVRQGLSGCQEGNAIEARNSPFAGETGSVDMNPDVNVTITNNTVSDYQKNGITVNGAVIATVTGNVVTGDGPANYIAQNGIQIGFGGSATVRSNTVSGNDYSPRTTVACGVLLYRADGVKASANDLFANQKDMCNYGKGGGNVNSTN